MADNKTILITGGAGYIGSATVLYMLENNYKVIVIDKKKPESKFFQSSKQLVPADLNKVHSFRECENGATSPFFDNVIFIQSDYSNEEVLNYIFNNYNIEAVIHFAGFIEVGRSVKDPAAFYQNNVVKTINLLDQMRYHGVKKIIFSSSAAVYGYPERGACRADNLTEDHLKSPINPYGRTKYFVELILEDYVQAYQMQAICLRYFNAAGALPDYDIGERHDPETHLIPLLLKAAYTGNKFNIFGTNYDTSDGTCIRDYLHIYDLAKAHYLALRYLDTTAMAPAPSDNSNCIFDVFNLGTGRGYSVREVINYAEKITSKKIDVVEISRRQGDPAKLVADATKVEYLLGWKPTMSSLENILQSANAFYIKTGNNYQAN